MLADVAINVLSGCRDVDDRSEEGQVSDASGLRAAPELQYLG